MSLSRVAGTSPQQFALMFVDWLASHPGVPDYLAAKRAGPQSAAQWLGQAHSRGPVLGRVDGVVAGQLIGAAGSVGGVAGSVTGTAGSTAVPGGGGSVSPGIGQAGVPWHWSATPQLSARNPGRRRQGEAQADNWLAAAMVRSSAKISQTRFAEYGHCG